MTTFAAIVLAILADEAQAGAAYKEAVEAVRLGRYDEAVAKLQEAIRHEPRETDRLLYRDKQGRHSDPYYPHYVWSQARALQARGETALARRRELLREAVTHLELTRHPHAAEMMEKVRAELSEVEKTAATPATDDASVVALRRRIEALCDQERFVEAARAAAAEKSLLDRFPAERAHLREAIERHRAVVVERHARSLHLALETVAAAPDRREPIPRLLEPTLLPSTVSETPDPRFDWAREFLAAVRTEPADAKSFDALASKAEKAGLPPGARAARMIADSVRFQALAACRDDARLGALLDDAEEAIRRTGETGPHAARVREIRDRLRRRTALRNELEQWLRRAEGAFDDPAVMSDPDALATLAAGLAPIEERPGWEEAPSALRARGFLLRSLLEAVAAILSGEPLPSASPGVKAARALDPDVDRRWRERLSPKLGKWLERLP